MSWGAYYGDCHTDLCEDVGLSFELARLTGKETQQDTWLDKEGKWGRSASDICSHLDALGFDSLQYFLRLPVDSRGSVSWRTIKYHCQVADQSQSFYRCVSPEQWLLTLVQSSRPAEIFDSSEDDLIIHSNVLPRQAYLQAPCLKHQHCSGFFLADAIVDGSDIPNPQSCENCALAEHMWRNDGMPVDELDNLLRFWFLEVEEVDLVDELGEGSEGKVSKIRWRKGVFARKTFYGGGRNVNMNAELDVAFRVSHPNIVRCFGCSRWADSTDCGLFMELLDLDLGRFLFEEWEKSGGKSPFSFSDLLDVLLQVARAMQHLHEKNVVHGDLKPENIFMRLFKTLAHSDVQYYLVKVGDFGSAQLVNDSGATVNPFNCKMGTLRYAAPEVLSCRFHGGAPPKYPQKIDVYSFGIVAYQLLTGIPLVFEDRFGRSLADDVIGGLRPDAEFDGTLDADRSSLLYLIRKCWTSDPGDRHSFSQICAEVDCLVERDRELQKMNGMSVILQSCISLFRTCFTGFSFPMEIHFQYTANC